MLLSKFLADFPEIDAEAGMALAEMSESVVHLDRKARLSLDIGIEKKGGRVMVQVNHSAKPPKPDPEAGLYFVHGRDLTKDDPYQGRIDDIDPETGEMKEHTTR